ncbi:hypothetical protein [Streptomyces sp. NPDC052225]|uniref:hypothetical protein n=1 Tax=Streptomyces sp. NPDC052225 TaxID=3154949 RepID=UPI00342C2625
MPLPDEDMTILEFLARLEGEDPGSRRAAAAARRLKKDVAEIALTTAQSPSTAFGRAHELLAHCGAPLATDSPPGGGSAVRGVVNSGFATLNPAVVTITVTPHEETGAAVLIRGAAKEGLIKQRAGRKGAEKIAALWLTDDPVAHRTN